MSFLEWTGLIAAATVVFEDTLEAIGVIGDIQTVESATGGLLAEDPIHKHVQIPGTTPTQALLTNLRAQGGYGKRV
jgi:hypothetical protein